MKAFILCFLVFWLFVSVGQNELQAFSNIENPAGLEVSGIVKSKLYPGVFWVHNDSGDSSRIFPIDSMGRILKHNDFNPIGGQLISDAVHVDWEDIAVDNQGNIVIADIGNNCNCRRDLALYYIRETNPIQRNNSVFKKVFIQYPDQTDFPAKKDNFNFDCEAIFYANDKLYFLTKHRSNNKTKLYALDSIIDYAVNELNLLGEFVTNGMVTAADVSEDGKTLVILTYEGVYLLKTKEPEQWFTGDIQFLPLKMKQAEGICLDDQSVIITDEFEGRMYRIKLSAFTNH